jgi:glycosyltransferase involved in cell wall biosynthesis
LKATRLLFFSFGFPPDFSGATLQALELAKALRRHGVTSRFLAETYRADLPARAEHEGFPVERLLRHGDHSIHRFGVALARAIARRARDFDVLWFNGNPGEFWTTAYATLAARALGKRVLVELNMEFYDGDPLRIRTTHFKRTKSWIARRVARYLPNSSAIERSFPRDLVGERVEILPYGIDLDRFRPPRSPDEALAARDALGLPRDRKVGCAVGAVTRRKNPDFVLRAWRRICERLAPRPPLLVWLGPCMTEDRECHDAAWVRELVSEAARGPLAGNVRFAGNVARPEEWLRAADGFVFASRQEGSPSVVREALGCGLPLVALELEGITDELVDDGRNGFLVPVHDRRAFRDWPGRAFEEPMALELFSDRVVQVLEEAPLAELLRERARETAERRFSIEARARRVLELLDPRADAAPVRVLTPREVAA